MKVDSRKRQWECRESNLPIPLPQLHSTLLWAHTLTCKKASSALDHFSTVFNPHIITKASVRQMYSIHGGQVGWGWRMLDVKCDKVDCSITLIYEFANIN